MNFSLKKLGQLLLSQFISQSKTEISKALIECFLSQLSKLLLPLSRYINGVCRTTDVITDLPLHRSIQHHAAASTALLSLQWDHGYGYESYCIR